MQLIQDGNVKKVAHMPTLCILEKGICPGYYTPFGLDPNVMYIATRKGWDLKNSGSEVYYIEKLGKWVPSSILDVINGVSPN